MSKISPAMALLLAGAAGMSGPPNAGPIFNGPRPRYGGGTGKCACGRTISANKSHCRNCAEEKTNAK